MSHQRGVDPAAEDNSDKAEPSKLKADDPGDCPRPDGCTCTWTALSRGWSRGQRAGCPVH